ncbi:MAG: ParB/RepB/Spo0J family partition protein [Blautia sp.]|nr:ParB/RepB/Spo0J family partition protein [Blautia sp.]
MIKKDSSGNAGIGDNENIMTDRKEGEIIVKLPVKSLVPFYDHPFKVIDNEAMLRICESVSQVGVMVPLIVRPVSEGYYEVISGHRRLRAAELAGITELPAIVREMDDDGAVIAMVDANLQREELLPSERAWAYRMKLDAIKHQGIRTDMEVKRTSGQVGPKLKGQRSNKIVADQAGESVKQVQRYIRLTYLIPELLEMVDRKEMAFSPAVELSYLSEREQRDFLSAMSYTQNMPSLSQAQRLKRLASDGRSTFDVMCSIMSEEKKDIPDNITFKGEELRKYFPKSYTTRQMENTIIKLPGQWQGKRERYPER